MKNKESLWTLIREKLFKTSLMEEVWDLVYTMIQKDKVMFQNAHHLLRVEYQDEQFNILLKMDKEVNAMQQIIREKVLNHLLISDISKYEIPQALGIITVINGLERIGDNCKNIADLAMAANGTVDYSDLEETVTTLENIVFRHFDELLEAIKTDNLEISKRIMNEYKEDVSRRIDETVLEILKGNYSKLPPQNMVSAALYLRYLKRIDANQRSAASLLVNPFKKIGYNYNNEGNSSL
ncbi:MAG: PhoU domain-containing protein [Candidatus Marinimicrobia bacterium]|nr:PhoU domain-containing protein [Candidatus Neomarinimicrobiota bacterium]MDD5582655.1 PhoU domain-containing protein [Candidatus Neomarinimicrobiota bacterium]